MHKRNYNIKTSLTEELFKKLCTLRGVEKKFRVNRQPDKMQVYITREELNTIRGTISPIRRLFFDIETSPMICYTWRIGSKINLNYDNIIDSWRIICICYKWEGEEEVHSLNWDSKQSDALMLREFIEVARIADELIGHNSDKFDIKKVRTRCLLHNIPAFPKYRSFDTLKKARGNFAFDNNSLEYIGRYLGVGEKVKHEGFAMWKDVMKNDETALKQMIEYCKGDVILLEDVYHALQHYVKPNTHSGVHLLGAEYRYSCPICSSCSISLVKNDVTQKGTISRVVECNQCGQVYNISNKSYSKFLEHKMNGKV